MSETKEQTDILEQFDGFDFCAKCDAVIDGRSLIDSMSEEVRKLRARVAELESGKPPMYSRVRVLVQVECDREQVPGWGHDPQQMADGAALRVMQLLAVYRPKLCLATYASVE